MSATALIHTTRALCPYCSEVLPASLVERDRDVYLETNCPTHGAVSHFYFRDAGFYRSLHDLRSGVLCCDTYECARGEPCSQREKKTMIYMINVTNNCNMTCQACYSGSEIGMKEPYDSPEKLLSSLPDPKELGFSPHAVFIGGEPTMHRQLPGMIQSVCDRGYVARLATNGLKLRKARYARELADAGLSWVFLHFDSLDDELNKKLRGRTMLEESFEAIERCHEAGIKVQLGMTVAPENIHELRAMFETAREKEVFWVSLYPVAEIERAGSAGSVFLSDVVDAIEEQTGGQVARSDFIAATRIWSNLFRLTKRYNYRQKPTMVSLPTVVDGDRMVPVNRLVSPTAALRYPTALARFARALPSLMDYEKREPTGDTMVINIQQFQGRKAFDLEEATHSLMSFAHEGSFLPFDIFNHSHRYRTTESPLLQIETQGHSAAS